ILTTYAVFHFPERFHFIVAVMEQGSSRKCGYRLAELDQHAFLLGLLVPPKEVVGFVFVAYDQHSNEIIEAAPRYAFDVKVYRGVSTRQLGRAMDIDFVFPECQSLQGKVPRLCWVPGSFGCPPRTECVGELM